MSTQSANQTGLAIALVGLLASAGLVGWAMAIGWESASPPGVTLTAFGTTGGDANAAASSEAAAVLDIDLPAGSPSIDRILADAAAEASRIGDELDNRPDRVRPRITLSGDALSSGDDPSLRWSIYFPEGITTEEYAELLDQFGIELGVLQPGGQVLYASQLNEDVPATRTGAAGDEGRMYLSWTRGDLADADRTLLIKADIDPGTLPVLHFLPAELEVTLSSVERESGGLRSAQIARTQFGLRRVNGTWQFFVLEQTPLR
jgi:hypothetical protein